MATQDTDASRAKKPGKPKDFTSRLPMVDLETAIGVVTAIREKGLEIAPASNVAKALGYKSPTSSPFYIRMLAGRLFGLLSSKSVLSQRALDFLKPRDEQTKAMVLVDAIMGIPAYKDLVSLYADKKINTELVANAIETQQQLTLACALLCSKVFESSLRFAGMLSPDGIVGTGPGIARSTTQEPPPAPAGASGNVPPSTEPAVTEGPDTQAHTLFLDKGKVRRFSFHGPVEVTQAEYERICQWLKVTLIVEDGPKGGNQ